MTAQLQLLIDAIRGVVASPASDPARTLLIVAMGIIATMVVLLLLLILLLPPKRKIVKVRRYRLRSGEDDGYYHPKHETAEGATSFDSASEEGSEDAHNEPAVPPAPNLPMATRHRTALRAAGAWAPLALVLAALASAYVITGSDAYCAKTCHVNEATVAQAAKLRHANCVACHEKPGLTGIPQNIVDRVSMVVARVEGSSSHGALIDSRSCLRCHDKQMRATMTVAGGIRMSHVEPDAAGATCTSCHGKAGHSRSRTASMSSCLVCHDSRTASADCLTCHVSQPLATVSASSAASIAETSTFGSGRIAYPLVDVPSRQCGRCHDLVRQCDTCHGLRMPHSEAFISGGHAPVASFGGKQLCWKCHQQTDCRKCHSDFATGHPANWDQGHRTQPWDTGCACHAKGQPPDTGCFLCHRRTGSRALLR